MQALLDPYVRYGPFRDLLITHRAILAGSAPLAAYLKEHDLPSFTPTDIDVWIPPRARPFLPDPVPLFIAHLEREGYQLTHEYASTDTEYREEMTIATVLTLQKGQRTIQLIAVEHRDPIAYIASAFDLSPCVTWWDPAEDALDTLYPADTRRRIMYRLYDATPSPRHIERIEKYLHRGFRIQDAPPPAEIAADPLEHLAPFANLPAFDVIAYEEINCAEFLAASRWHILVRTLPSTTFHAYHREQLIDYLLQHPTPQYAFGKGYTFPHKQTVLQDALNYLSQSDFSVYELRPSGTHQSHSFYSLYSYTVKGWAMHGHGAICYAVTSCG
jgi:hypothetical protein